MGSSAAVARSSIRTDLRPLSAEHDVPAVQALLSQALSFDTAAPVVCEKLFAGNGVRAGQAIGAFSDGALLGVLAQAGRWIKILAVHPQARRHGLGTTLLQAARAWLDQQPPQPATGNARPKLRCGDHPGNYLAPGIDARDDAGAAFLRASGFVEVGRNLNLKAPVRDNPVLRAEHIAEKQAAVQAHGYRVRRATAGDAPALLAMVTSAFHRVWAYEVARALGPGLGGEAALHTPDLPEGSSVHIALSTPAAGTGAGDGEIVAFAAHDGNNRGLGWFGPTGTLPAHRGKGIGEVLLLHCLHDVEKAHAAQPSSRPDAGVIAWVGPVEYYARSCGAVPDRHFVVYEEAA